MSSSDKKIEPRRLKGFQDYMPDVMEVRSGFQAAIRQQAKLAGFREIGTPALEFAETLLGQGSDETDKQVYRFEDQGGRKVAMRFDLTIPFARFVAEHQGVLVFPFKRLQIGDVWRGENTQKGRYREFCQCDLDIIGVDSANADVEVLSCMYRILCGFDLGGFTMRLGNRVLLSALLAKAFPGIDGVGETAALIALDKIEKIGGEAVALLLAKIPCASIDSAKNLLACVTAKDATGGTDTQVLQTYLAGNEAGLAELKRMNTILAIMGTVSNALPAGVHGGKIRFDLSIARGLAYYTGLVYETTLDGLPGFGSISSGGRYNNLAERFINRSLPGVGGSIGLDRLLAGLEELGKLGAVKSDLVFIAVATEDALESAANLAGTLRSAGVACHMGLTPGKVGNQFKHADRLGCLLVVTLGTSEVETNTYNLKNMKSGDEAKGLPRSGIIDRLNSENLALQRS
jgi:histidyl-tRNA synthetase